ncbi:EAL domain-containing protein [Clostridium sp. B9]|uniref:EAL domain-containing protein n=1 Tax=Clostridium sp. B9 TaxID=3423224 RepID=UPI003D2F279B
MRKKHFFLTLILIFITTLSIVCFQNYNYKLKNNKEVIKVGFYSQYPYYYRKQDGTITGYYNDLLEEISKKADFNYEYVDCVKADVLESLKNGDIDLAFGITKTKEREKDFLFGQQYINNENYAIFTNKDIKFGDIDKLNGSTMAYVEGDINDSCILDMLEDKGMDINVIKVKSSPEAYELLKDGKADFTVENRKDNIKNKKGIKSIFEFSTEPVYIVTRKDEKALMEKIDECNYLISSKSSFKKLYFKYFGEKNIYGQLIAIIALVVLGILIFRKQKKKIRFRRKQESIRSDLEKGKFLLYYQPIIDPKTNRIKGFEALLRLKKDDKILTPYHFFKDIEEYDMSLEVALWCYEQVISDYEIIKNYDVVKGDKFYISFNVSFEEIRDTKFLKELLQRVEKYDDIDNRICLEIVEKFGVKEAGKIQDAIKEIKNYGFLIAIDDFGVEYSNLDLLHKIDSDIIKLDKYFVDNLDDIINVKIVEFISEVCKVSNRTIVFEGVEQKKQVDMIKAFSYEKIYIQGYYYSKPLDIERLKYFNVIS